MLKSLKELWYRNVQGDDVAPPVGKKSTKQIRGEDQKMIAPPYLEDHPS